MAKQEKKRWKKKWTLSPMQWIALVFAGMILLGACLLCLPIASRDRVPCGFLPALFTATSATCITGLTIYDTYTQWSGFGQTVIILLIQIGGLGFMSAAAMVVFLLGKRVGFKQKMVMAQALNLDDMDEVVKIQKMVLIGSFSVEAVGALILMLRFLPEYGFRQALIWGVFHSISAFCNAGFDIFGSLEPGTSLSLFAEDPVVILTISGLVIVGGLGFLVWDEVIRVRTLRKFTVYTKLVLLSTLALLVLGTVAFCLLEWNNPATIGNMDTGAKILGGFFQAVTTRTAGYFAMDQAGLTEGSKAVSIGLMMVGGSSGSTAGGVKTVTIVVLLMFLWARARGRETVTLFKRTVPASQALNAMTIIGVFILLAFAGAVFVTATSPVGFTDSLYETVSALATVGLTAGATGKLSVAAKILIIVYMYFGRVGLLTISMGFLMGNRAQERYRYAHTHLLIG